MLKNILNLLAREGVNTTDEASKAHAIIAINNAAARLYSSRDLEHSLDEDVLQVAVATHQVALPHKIGKLRKIRPYWGDGGSVSGVWGVENRYQHSGDKHVNELNYRKRPSRALCTSISNASTIRLMIPLAVVTDLVVVIIGSNSNTSNIIERLVIPAGSTEAESTNTYADVKQLLRSGDATYNVLVLDCNSVVLACIPNNASESRYEVIQVVDSWVEQALTGVFYPIEVFYKKALGYLSDDNDSFVCGDVYDEAIFWQYRVHESARMGDEKGMRMAEKQVTDIIADIAKDTTRGLDKRTSTPPSPYIGAQELISRGAFRK